MDNYSREQPAKMLVTDCDLFMISSTSGAKDMGCKRLGTHRISHVRFKSHTCQRLERKNCGKTLILGDSDDFYIVWLRQLFFCVG